MNSNSIIRRQFSYSYFNVNLALIILNVGIHILDTYVLGGPIRQLFALVSYNVLNRGFLWQPFTYMFIHGSMNHLFFNMLALVFFGFTLERRMGSKEYLLFYLLTGTLTGIVSTFIMFNSPVPLVGASGAIYALLLAFATYFPDSQILLFFVLPLRAPLAVLLFAVIAVFMQIFDPYGGVAHFAHLAGIGFGFLYFIIRFGVNPLNIFRRR